MVVEPTHLKNMIVKLDHFLRVNMKNIRTESTYIVSLSVQFQVTLVSVHQVDHWPSKSAPQSQSVQPGASRIEPVGEPVNIGSLQVGKGSVINIGLMFI